MFGRQKEARLVQRTAASGHRMYGEVTSAMQRANGVTYPHRYKPFNTESPQDKATFDRLANQEVVCTAAVRMNQSGKPEIDILRATIDDIPAQFQDGSRTSSQAALQGIKRELGPRRFIPPLRKRALGRLQQDVATTRADLHTLEHGDLTDDQQREVKSRLGQRKTSQIAGDVHAVWGSNNKEREEARQGYATLAPFVQEQDVVWVDAAVQVLASPKK